MDTATLTQILIKEITPYANDILNGHSYLTKSADNRVFAVISVDNKHNEYSGDAGLIARVDDDKIIIEHDMYNKPLVDALVQAGVPREQIVLTYSGEALSETA
ncbi:MAG: element excision factor XisI family protein [Aggregatilineales bacterium]